MRSVFSSRRPCCREFVAPRQALQSLERRGLGSGRLAGTRSRAGYGALYRAFASRTLPSHEGNQRNRLRALARREPDAEAFYYEVAHAAQVLLAVASGVGRPPKGGDVRDELKGPALSARQSRLRR